MSRAILINAVLVAAEMRFLRRAVGPRGFRRLTTAPERLSALVPRITNKTAVIIFNYVRGQSSDVSVRPPDSRKIWRIWDVGIGLIINCYLQVDLEERMIVHIRLPRYVKLIAEYKLRNNLVEII